jgi:hypothetical protein
MQILANFTKKEIEKIKLLSKINGYKNPPGYARWCVLKELARYDLDIDFNKVLQDRHCDEDII